MRGRTAAVGRLCWAGRRMRQRCRGQLGWWAATQSLSRAGCGRYSLSVARIPHLGATKVGRAECQKGVSSVSLRGHRVNGGSGPGGRHLQVQPACVAAADVRNRQAPMRAGCGRGRHAGGSGTHPGYRRCWFARAPHAHGGGHQRLAAGTASAMPARYPSGRCGGAQKMTLERCALDSEHYQQLAGCHRSAGMHGKQGLHVPDAH